MRPLFFAFLFLCVSLAVRGETMREWLDAAPKADIAFTPWDGDLPSVIDPHNPATPLLQGFYGTLDLSRLPAEVFPIKLRLVYDAPASGDIAAGSPGGLSRLKEQAPVGPGPVVIESLFSKPTEASAIPVWTEPSPVRGQMNDANPEENVRAEIESHTGALVARWEIGVSASNRFQPSAVLVNAPGASPPFADGGYATVNEVKRLVPDSYAFLNVDTIWIDAATVVDPALTDAFWRQVLLGGTTVAGRSGDIGVLAKRLNLTPGEPFLLGKLVAADSPEAFIKAQGPFENSFNGSVLIKQVENPFSFFVVIGKEMHKQLLNFSILYLGAFAVLQAVVIFAAFQYFRGARRVWLWLVVPGFALAYALAGIVFAHVAVHARSETRLTQMELLHQEGPEALLLTHLEQIDLADRETVLHLSEGSRPYIPGSPAGLNGTWAFRQNNGPTITIHNRPATRMGTDVSAIIPAQPPCQVTSDGRLEPLHDFSGAWLWDGTNWHNLGPLIQFQTMDWKKASIISPTTSRHRHFIRSDSDDPNFPSFLGSLLEQGTLKAMTASGEGLFLGVKPIADVKLESTANDSVASRRVVAYQFRLPEGTR